MCKMLLAHLTAPRKKTTIYLIYNTRFKRIKKKSACNSAVNCKVTFYFYLSTFLVLSLYFFFFSLTSTLWFMANINGETIILKFDIFFFPFAGFKHPIKAWHFDTVGLIQLIPIHCKDCLTVTVTSTCLEGIVQQMSK